MKVTPITTGTDYLMCATENSSTVGDTAVYYQDRSEQYCEKTFSSSNHAVNASTNGFAAAFEKYTEKTNSFGKK